MKIPKRVSSPLREGLKYQKTLEALMSGFKKINERQFYFLICQE